MLPTSMKAMVMQAPKQPLVLQAVPIPEPGSNQGYPFIYLRIVMGREDCKVRSHYLICVMNNGMLRSCINRSAILLLNHLDTMLLP